MRFSSRYHTRKRKSKSRSKSKPSKRLRRISRKGRRVTRTRKQKGGANTFSRNIPKNAIKSNPLAWDDNSYYDLAGEEELLSA